MIDELYETIGGNQTVWKAVDIFYNRVLADDSLKHFFRGTDMASLHGRQSMFVSMLLGGRVVYTGKDIGEAHEGVRLNGVTDAKFDAFLGHFRAALDEVGVKPDVAEKIMMLLESKRSAVVKGGESKGAGE